MNFRGHALGISDIYLQIIQTSSLDCNYCIYWSCLAKKRGSIAETISISIKFKCKCMLLYADVVGVIAVCVCDWSKKLIGTGIVTLSGRNMLGAKPVFGIEFEFD